MLRDDQDINCISHNYFENENNFLYLDVLNIENNKLHDIIFDHTFSVDSSTYDSPKIDIFSFMDFSSNEEKLEDSSSKNHVKSLFCCSEPIPEVKHSKKKEKKKNVPKLTCEICQMEFKHKWIYERHLDSHSTSKFYICQIEGCKKSYKSKENLNLHHKNVHEKIKPYTCTYCELKFSHRNGIDLIKLGKTYHERKFHMNYLPHVCKVLGCSKSFASKSALAYHTNNQHTSSEILQNCPKI